MPHSPVRGFGGAVDADVVVENEHAGDDGAHDQQKELEGLGVVVQEQVAGHHQGHVAEAAPHFQHRRQQADDGKCPGQGEHEADTLRGEDAVVALQVVHQLVAVPRDQGDGDDGCACDRGRNRLILCDNDR